MIGSIPVHIPQDFADYELIDSGNGAKLERYGTYVMSRPDPRALWKRQASSDIWAKADAEFIRTSDQSGNWHIRTRPPSPWILRYGNLSFVLKSTAFKHIGVFPEQAVNWDFLMDTIGEKPLKILNLFAYTGGATLACLAAGASVTHVDASKPSLSWATENAAASGLDGKPVRWILDDAYKFVLREGRRGNTYDGIIMDPPLFGRGSKGEVWKLTDDLVKLVTACKSILSDQPAFFLLNAYTVDLSAITLGHIAHDLIKLPGSLEYGELALKDSTSGRLLPSGIFARWRNS